MAFCAKCGAELEEGAKFCPSCGASVEAKAENNEPAEKKSENGNNNDIGMCVLAYLFWLCLVPFFAKKDSEFCQFHAKKGMNVAILESIIIVVQIILSSVFNAIGVYWLATLFNVIFDLALTGIAVACVFAIISACKGEKKDVPVIGKFINFVK